MKRRLVYAGYNFFSSVLQAFLERKDVEIVLCLTGNIDEHVSNVMRLAVGRKIPVHHGKLDESVRNLITQLSPEIIFCAAYSYRIPVTRLGIRYNLNLHPSLLPHGRGPNPLPYLVGNQKEFSGLTIHEMTDKFDQGSILEKEAIPVGSGWGFDALAMEMYVRAPVLVNRVFDDLDNYFAKREPQVVGSYWPLPDAIDRRVDWTEPVAAIGDKSRRFGALGILCLIDGREYEITTPIAYISTPHVHAPGEVLLYGKGFWYVAASDGIVRITQVT
jgi:methionyl-tRNA formyltransferase